MATRTDFGSEPGNRQYCGFWVRLAASLLDGLLFGSLLYTLLVAVYGETYFDTEQFVFRPLGFIIQYVLPPVMVIGFWAYKAATPGKMVFGLRIADARTGDSPSIWRLTVRYLAYSLSLIPFGLGFLWVAWDPRKQGWHDKVAGTVVVRPVLGGADSVRSKKPAKARSAPRRLSLYALILTAGVFALGWMGQRVYPTVLNVLAMESYNLKRAVTPCLT